MKPFIYFSLFTFLSLTAVAEVKTPKCYSENPGSCNTGEEMRVISDYKPSATDAGCCFVDTAWSGPIEGKTDSAKEAVGTGGSSTQIE